MSTRLESAVVSGDPEIINAPLSPVDMTTAPLDLLFRPFSLGRTALRNRIAMAPMTRRQCPGGVPHDRVAAYYKRRAEGGVGLIITEGTYIDHPGANAYAGVPAFHGDEALDGWTRVAEAVHAAGARIIPQLWHTGSVRRPGIEPDPSVPGFGPAGITDNDVQVVRAMTAHDIADVVASFARAAVNAERLGFDGVEIHGAHGYLLDQFLWAQTNTRHDKYGGSLGNRVRLAVEVVDAIRGAVSPDFPVVFRFSQWKSADYGARIAENPDELEQIITPLVRAGVDCFHVSTRRFWEPAFSGSDATLAEWTRRVAGRPVIAVGSVGLDKPHQARAFRDGPDVAAQVADLNRLLEHMQRDAFDLVAIGRAVLSDPDWVHKVRRGEMSRIHPFDRTKLDTLL